MAGLENCLCHLLVPFAHPALHSTWCSWLIKNLTRMNHMAMFLRPAARERLKALAFELCREVHQD